MKKVARSPGVTRRMAPARATGANETAAQADASQAAASARTVARRPANRLLARSILSSCSFTSLCSRSKCPVGWLNTRPMPDALRIALITYRGNPHSGGQGIYVRYLIRSLVELGHTV